MNQLAGLAVLGLQVSCSLCGLPVLCVVCMVQSVCMLGAVRVRSLWAELGGSTPGPRGGSVQRGARGVMSTLSAVCAQPLLTYTGAPAFCAPPRASPPPRHRGCPYRRPCSSWSLSPSRSQGGTRT